MCKVCLFIQACNEDASKWILLSNSLINNLQLINQRCMVMGLKPKSFKIPKVKNKSGQMKVDSLTSPLPASLPTKRTNKTFVELRIAPFLNVWVIPPHLRNLHDNPDGWTDILLKLGPKKARLSSQAYFECLSVLNFLMCHIQICSDFSRSGFGETS